MSESDERSLAQSVEQRLEAAENGDDRARLEVLENLHAELERDLEAPENAP